MAMPSSVQSVKSIEVWRHASDKGKTPSASPVTSPSPIGSDNLVSGEQLPSKENLSSKEHLYSRENIITVDKALAALATPQKTKAEFTEDMSVQNYVSLIQQHVKKGFLTLNKVAIEANLTWEKEFIAPIQRLDSRTRKEMAQLSKLIQVYMGDKTLDTTESEALGVQGMPLDVAQSRSRVAKHIISTVFTNAELIDECVLQIVKQLTANPSVDSLKRGWELLACFCKFCNVSENLHAYFRNWLVHQSKSSDKTSILWAGYSLKKFDAHREATAPPSSQELAHLVQAPYVTSPYGASLEDIMFHQTDVVKPANIPEILATLMQHAVRLNSMQVEVAFTEECVGTPSYTAALEKLEKNDYVGADKALSEADGVASISLLRKWLNSLQDPLVPEKYEILEFPGSISHIMAHLSLIPRLNRDCMIFIVSRIQVKREIQD